MKEFVLWLVPKFPSPHFFLDLVKKNYNLSDNEDKNCTVFSDLLFIEYKYIHLRMGINKVNNLLMSIIFILTDIHEMNYFTQKSDLKNISIFISTYLFDYLEAAVL